MIAQAVVTQIEDTQVGEELLAEHAPNQLHALPLDVVVGEVKKLEGRTTTVLNRVGQMGQLLRSQIAATQHESLQMGSHTVS